MNKKKSDIIINNNDIVFVDRLLREMGTKDKDYPHLRSYTLYVIQRYKEE